MPITGTILNVAAILAGVVAGLATGKDFTPEWQVKIRKLLGVFMVWFGLKIVWNGFNGSFWQITHQFVIMMVALILGRMIGHGLRLQKSLNRLGQYAKQQFSRPAPGPASERSAQGFLVSTVVYCAAPLAVLGPLHEGLTGDFQPLAIKALMDGLAAMAFARLFGQAVALSLLPLVAYQGSWALLGSYLEPILRHRALVDSVEVTLGFQILCISLVILEIRKIQLSDYLPALIFAPLLTWWASRF
jgi:uncharacterized membrane protein YqgA involved in biofilm formation